MELEDSQLILEYIKEGIGIGYIEKSIVLEDSDLEIVPLEETLPTETIYLIYNETTISSTAREFITMISNN